MDGNTADSPKLRAWWAHRQGLDGSLAGKPPAEILEVSGWARSVGGVGPYLTLFARGGVLGILSRLVKRDGGTS